MTPTVAGYLVFGLYIVLNVVIGLWSGRQQKGADDLWTAGRRFGTVVMILGLMSSIMHGGSILSGTQAISHSSPAVQNGHTGQCIFGGATFSSRATRPTSASSVV